MEKWLPFSKHTIDTSRLNNYTSVSIKYKMVNGYKITQKFNN